jgi:hypothetical protein
MRLFCGSLLISIGCAGIAAFSPIAASPTSGVHPLFDLTSLERSPFPSDRFTVADDEQNTGRRVNLPMPQDCTVEVSECEDVAILNQLDGFNLNARISLSAQTSSLRRRWPRPPTRARRRRSRRVRTRCPIPVVQPTFHQR